MSNPDYSDTRPTNYDGSREEIYRSATTTTVAAKFPSPSRSNLQLGDIILKQAAEITRLRADMEAFADANHRNQTEEK